MPLYLETWKNLELDILSIKRPEKTWNWETLKKPRILNKKPGIFNNFNMFSSKISIWHKKYIIKIGFFCHHQKIFLLKNLFKVILQYLFNVFILFNTVSYIKLNFKQKIDPKMCTFKNLEKNLNKWVATLFIYVYMLATIFII